MCEVEVEAMQKKNLIALVVMALLLGVITPIAFIASPQVPRCKHLEGSIGSATLEDPLCPESLQGSLGVYYHYYGWQDGLSVLVIDRLSGKQMKPGSHAHAWGVSGSSSSSGSGSLPWLRSRYLREEEHVISVGVEFPGVGRQERQFTLSHQFDSEDAFHALVTVDGFFCGITSDTVIFIDHQLDGTYEVKEVGLDLSDLLGEPEDLDPRLRGVPTKEEVESYLLSKPAILELMLP